MLDQRKALTECYEECEDFEYICICFRSQNLVPPSASPILPKPPQGSRRRLNKAGTSTKYPPPFSAFESDFTATAVTNDSSTTINATTTTAGISNTAITTTTAAVATATSTTTTPAQRSSETLLVPAKRRTTSLDNDTQKNYENTPVSVSVSFPLDKSTDNSAPKKPVPVPRRNTLDRNLTSSSPLALSSIRSPDTSATSLPSIDIKDESTNIQVKQPRKELSSSSISTVSSVGSTIQGKESANDNSNVVIPIALAIQETVNASFKGKTYDNLYCMFVLLQC